MLVNPGGPGGSGLIFSLLGQFVPNHAGDAYDWIGFDPRGVGASVPSLSCNPTTSHGDRPPYYARARRRSSRRVAHAVRSVRRRRARPRTAAPARPPEDRPTPPGTWTASARRWAQQQINYYGFSYGTYLGQVYATLFPNRCGAWCSTASSTRGRSCTRPTSTRTSRSRRRSRSTSTGSRSTTPSTTWAAPRRRCTASTGQRSRCSTSTPRGAFSAGTSSPTSSRTPAYYVYDWDNIAHAWQNLVNKHQPGQMIQYYQSANPTTKAGDNGYAMYLGTQCTDARWPRSQARLNRDNWALNRKYPFLTWDNAWFNGPCAYWKYPHRTAVQVTGQNVHVPVAAHRRDLRPRHTL